MFLYHFWSLSAKILESLGPSRHAAASPRGICNPVKEQVKPVEVCMCAHVYGQKI